MCFQPSFRALVRAAILERAKGRSAVDGCMDLGRRLVGDAHPFTKWTASTERFFRTIRESPSLVARVREHREAVEGEVASALVESAATPADDATAQILAVAMVAAWRVAHVATTSARHAGKRGDALGDVFLRALDDALEPIRRAARGTPYGSGPSPQELRKKSPPIGR